MDRERKSPLRCVILSSRSGLQTPGGACYRCRAGRSAASPAPLVGASDGAHVVSLIDVQSVAMQPTALSDVLHLCAGLSRRAKLLPPPRSDPDFHSYIRHHRGPNPQPSGWKAEALTTGLRVINVWAFLNCGEAFPSIESVVLPSVLAREWTRESCGVAKKSLLRCVIFSSRSGLQALRGAFSTSVSPSSSIVSGEKGVPC